MSDSLKTHLKQTEDALKHYMDEVEDKVEDIGDDGKALWKKTRQHLGELGDKLSEAQGQLAEKSDELQLQAHLGAMDAHDLWLRQKPLISGFAEQVKGKSKTLVDSTVLQAHLAKMEGEDFVANTEHQLHLSRAALQEQSLKATTAIKEHFDGLIAGLPK